MSTGKCFSGYPVLTLPTNVHIGNSKQVGSSAFRCGDCLKAHQSVSTERFWQVGIAGENDLGSRHTSLRVANLDVDMRRGRELLTFVMGRLDGDELVATVGVSAQAAHQIAAAHIVGAVTGAIFAAGVGLMEIQNCARQRRAVLSINCANDNKLLSGGSRCRDSRSWSHLEDGRWIDLRLLSGRASRS